MKSELLNLNGGKKQFWLRTHWKEVYQYYLDRGPKETMQEYNVLPATLDRFLNNLNNYKNIQKWLSYGDKWVMKVANEGLSELRRQIIDLRERVEKMEPVVAIGQMILDATMIKVRAKVEKSNRYDESLKLRHFVESRKDDIE